MANRVIKNKFDGGLNTDISPSLTSPDLYRDAINMVLNSDGELFSLSPIQGVSELISFDVLRPDDAIADHPFSALPTNPNDAVLCGTYAVRSFGEQSNTSLDGLLVFVYSKDSDHMNGLWFSLQNLSSRELAFRYQVNENTIGEDIVPSSVSAVVFSQQNVDTVYFTDGVSTIKKARMSFQTSGAPNTGFGGISTISLEARRVMPTGMGIADEGISILNGGSLPTGSYQFSFRYINSRTLDKTRWGLISRPIRIITDASDEGRVAASAVVGANSNKSIRVDAPSPSPVERESYDNVQFAIIRNVDGTRNRSTNMEVKTVPIESGQLTYSSIGSVYGLENIDDLTVDDAAIISCNSIESKDNRLFFGGVGYRDLSSESILSSSNPPRILRIELAENEENLHDNSSAITFFPSHFRGEVYRYGYSYVDKYGNTSEPIFPDVNTFLGEGITLVNGGLDIKFPDRLQNKFIDGSQIGQEVTKVRSLGLNFTIEGDHPAWARAIIIVRAERIKKIKDQGLLISSRTVQAPLARRGYPDTVYRANKINGTVSPTTNTGVTLGNPIGTIIPKNLNKVFNYSIGNDTANDELVISNGISQRLVDLRLVGSGRESDQFVNFQELKKANFFYSPRFLHTSNGVLDGDANIFSSDTLRVVDYALLGGLITDNQTRDVFYGDSPTESFGNEASLERRTGAVYATPEPASYFSLYKSALPESLTTISKIIEGVNVPYDGFATLSKSPIDSNTVCNYRGINDSLNLFKDPVSQKSTIIVTQDSIEDPTVDSFRTAIVAQPQVGPVTNRPSINFRGFRGTSVRFVDPDTGDLDSFRFAENVTSRTADDSQVAVAICNIESDAGDDRYGSDPSATEYLYTGVFKLIDHPSDTITTGGFFTGDCFISSFLFKIQDNDYNIIANELNFDLLGFLSATENPVAGTSYNGGYFYATKYGHYFARLDNPEVGHIRPEAVTKTLSTSATESVYVTIDLESEIVSGSTDNSHAIRGYHEFLGQPNDPGQRFLHPSGLDVVPSYTYHAGISFNGGYKRVFSSQINASNRDYPYRIAYSDINIQDSLIDGYSRIRSENFYDMNPEFGDISKIINHKGDVICFQSSGYSYLPINSNIIEQSVGNEMVVRSGDVIGIPKYISEQSGCIHPSSINDSDNGIYFYDALNKNVCLYNGTHNEISKNVIETFIRSISSAERQVSDASTIIDKRTGDVIFFFKYNSFDEQSTIGIVFNESINRWVSRLGGESEDVSFESSALSGTNTYVLCRNSSNGNIGLILYRVSSRPNGRFFDTDKNPSFKYDFNSEIEIPKVIDNVIITATSELDELRLSINRPDSAPLNTTVDLSADSLDATHREGTLRVRKIRDDNSGARVRGTDGALNVLVGNEGDPKIYSVVTKYRTSSREL